MKVAPTMRINTSSQPNKMRAANYTMAMKPSTASQSTFKTFDSRAATNDVSMSMSSGKFQAASNFASSQRLAANRAERIKMSATSNNQFSSIQDSQMNVDTSKWGKVSMKNSFSSGFNMDSISNIKDQFIGKSKAVAQASKKAAENISFEITNSAGSNQIRENFQDAAFGAPRRILAQRKFNRGGVVLAALPKDAEGSWGDVDRDYVIGGNWKSNGDWEFINNFPKDVLAKAEYDDKKITVCVAPTDVHLATVKKNLEDTQVNAMAQDVSEYGKGAYTGNVTADQIKDLGVNWTLTGHSERRTLFGETDEITADKTKIAIENGLNVMVCIGEQLEEREAGTTGEVNARQLQAVADKLTEGQWGNVVIAYEPVWAIGTGKVATKEQAQETHAEIRQWLAENISPEVAGATRILYGGSVNGENAFDLIGQKDIDGFLVGGASLKEDFKQIIKAADDNKKGVSSEKKD